MRDGRISRTPGSVPDWATLPNAITLLRFALVLPITAMLIRDAAPAATLVLLMIFGISDWVDGFLARKLNQTSRVGAALDPIADRVGVAVIVLTLVISGRLPLWIALTRWSRHAPGVDLGVMG